MRQIIEKLNKETNALLSREWSSPRWNFLEVRSFYATPYLREVIAGSKSMRNSMLAILALLAAGAVTIASSTSAAALDYPWCIQGGGWGVPGDCSYRSYAECMMSASGRQVYCNTNPRVAFGQQQRRSRSRY